jgi:hypothetical protein
MKWKLLIGVILVAVALWAAFWRGGSMSNALHTRELATRGLAAYLTAKSPNGCAVVFSNPFTQQKGLEKGIYAQEEAGLRGLREGFGQRVKIEAVVFPELKPEARQNPSGMSMPEGTTTPLSYLVAEGSFDKLALEHSQCHWLVSLIGLPEDVEQLHIWDAADPHKFALLLPDFHPIGDLAALRKAVLSGKIAAFVLNKPGAPPEGARVSGGWKAEFEKRFVLVTSENFEERVKQYPQLFQTLNR